MRKTVSVGVLALALGLTAGCDSEDPAQVGTQTMTIEINAVSLLADSYHVWNMIEDNDSDNLPDDGQTYLWCEGPNGPGNNLNQTPITASWPFSVQIDLIRAGATERTTITSEAAASATGNVAKYDAQLGREGFTPAKAPVTMGTRTFKFTTGRVMSGVNQAIMFARTNPLASLQGNRIGVTCPAPPPGTVPSTSRTRCGLCSVTNAGPARIDGIVAGTTVQCRSDIPTQCAMPYTIDLEKGDTLIFQSRIAASAPPGFGLESIRQNPTSLSATVMVGGKPVTVQGNREGAALSFSFTSR